MANSNFIKSNRALLSPVLVTTAVFVGVIGTYVSIKALAATAPTTKTATRLAPKIATTSSHQSAKFGQPVTLTASVPAACGNTGTVSFYDGPAVNTNLLGSQVVSSGRASFTSASLNPGVHQIKAVYRGNTVCQSALAAPLAETIAKPSGTGRGTTISLASARSTVVANAAVSLIANVAGDCGPTGNVNFYDGAVKSDSLLGSAPYRNGRAVLSRTMPAGSHKIIATYEGDSGCDKSVSQPLMQTVSK